jgi:hypothetical protein
MLSANAPNTLFERSLKSVPLGGFVQWLLSYRVRLTVALASMLVIYMFPVGEMTTMYFGAVLIVYLAASFASTMMSVSQV